MNLDAASDDRTFVRVVCVGERAVVETKRSGDVVESVGQFVLHAYVRRRDVAAVSEGDRVAERLTRRGRDVILALDEFDGRKLRVGRRREARAVAEDVDDRARILSARVERVGHARTRVDANRELLTRLAAVRVNDREDADALAARETRTHRRVESYLRVGICKSAGSVRVEVERDERGRRGNGRRR